MGYVSYQSNLIISHECNSTDTIGRRYPIDMSHDTDVKNKYVEKQLDFNYSLVTWMVTKEGFKKRFQVSFVVHSKVGGGWG